MAPMIIKSVLSYTITDFASSYCYFGKIPNVATEKEPKKSFLYLTDVTLVVADIQLWKIHKKYVYLQQDLLDVTMDYHKQ